MQSNLNLEDPDYQKILQIQDFFPKIFLQPSQIRLDKQQGLKVIKRNSKHPDKYQEQNVRPIMIQQNEINKFKLSSQIGQQEHPAGHGLLSLFKRTNNRRVKLAICVCVYSQSKHMLKSTIKGIQESNKDFYEKAGIMSHEIIVIVIFDGIQHLNCSKDQTENMISFFNEIDIKNGFRQRSNTKSLDEFLKELQENKFNFSAINEDKLNQINLFTEDELSELQPKLFQNQYNQYLKTKKLLSQISRIKNVKDLKIDILPFEVVKKYQDLCINFCAQNNFWFETQEQIQDYLTGSRKNIRFKLMYEALCEVEILCKQYLESRNDKTILYPVRMEKNDLKNPRAQQNADDEFSSLIHDAQRKQFNYLFFCVKHKNQGKLNSHMLFFEGFCKTFDPQFCMLMDVGVKPQKDSIFKMWKHMQLHPKCGGVCGYMSLKMENPSDDLGYRSDGYDEKDVDCFTRMVSYFVSIQRAQQFQYHYAHMLDKPFQSFFNYIHVLPGAFSGYRWKALKSVAYKERDGRIPEDQIQLQSQRYTYQSTDSQQEQEQTLLKRYLKTALQDKHSLSLQDSNMYLAQDRILCLGIHALGYDLHYLPDAQSYVDPVTSLTKLMGQRRRWINGSWFAFNYVRQHSYQSNSCLFMIQLLYYSFVQKLQWIAPALFYVAMNLTLISFITNNILPTFQNFFRTSYDYELSKFKFLGIFNLWNMILSIPDLFNYFYIIAVCSVLLFSALVNHNCQRFKPIYYGASTLIGVYGLLVFALLFYNAFEIISKEVNDDNKQEDFLIPLIYFRGLIIFVIVGFALPILWTFSFRKGVEMITCVISYLYYSPTYINILQTFAFSRVDDLSWGTKGLDHEEGVLISRQWQKRKYIFILQYLATNLALSYILVSLAKFDYPKNIIILGTAILVFFLLIFRLLFALFYLIKYYSIRSCSNIQNDQISLNRNKGYKIYNALNLIELKIKQIEKQKTKKKKQQEYKNLASATSLILSKALSNFGKKIRSKVAQHIVNNNMIAKNELEPYKNRKRKGLNSRRSKERIKSMKSNDVIQEVDQSESIDKKQLNRPQRQVQDIKQEEKARQAEQRKSEIKSMLKSIKDKYKKRFKKDQ